MLLPKKWISADSSGIISFIIIPNKLLGRVQHLFQSRIVFYLYGRHRDQNILLLVFSTVPSASHLTLVSWDVATDHQAAFEAIVNKTIHWKGKRWEGLWSLNVGESLIFYCSLLVQMKKIFIYDLQDLILVNFSKGMVSIKWKIKVIYNIYFLMLMYVTNLLITVIFECCYFVSLTFLATACKILYVAIDFIFLKHRYWNYKK